MKKLWKRLVMLGALVGCMATAAWAGNVEVDPLTDNIKTNYAAEGYYETVGPGIYVDEDGTKIETKYEYHFDSAGRIAWQKHTVVPDVVYYNTRYIYDQDGNLIREVSSNHDFSGFFGYTGVYAYDEQGRVLEYEYQSRTGYVMTISFTYEKEKIIREEVINGELYDKIEYTLNEKKQIVARDVYKKRGDDSGEFFLYSYDKYTYDDNGNLVKAQTYIDDDVLSSDLTFSYRENGQCISCESRSLGTKEYDVENYEYDENGNIVKVTREVYSGEGKITSTDSYEYTYEKLAPVQDDSVFTDVTDKNGFAYDAIIWATETGITKGTTETTFSPRAQCTRAQMVTFLWRAAGSPEPTTTENPFTDVKEGAYYKAILWAVENGITKGTSADKFSPNAQCTRAQIVTFIYRAAGEPEVENGTNPFTDVKGGAYYDAILWAVENGITNGTTATTFSPSTVCNRGQGVTFLYRGIGLY